MGFCLVRIALYTNKVLLGHVVVIWFQDGLTPRLRFTTRGFGYNSTKTCELTLVQGIRSFMAVVGIAM
uniref:Putative cnidarian restricted secreted protein n=1 Tax=Clytia hemisphaerica TaxID=252671 RepID=A0A069DMK2_9CNID